MEFKVGDIVRVDVNKLVEYQITGGYHPSNQDVDRYIKLYEHTNFKVGSIGNLMRLDSQKAGSFYGAHESFVCKVSLGKLTIKSLLGAGPNEDESGRQG